VGGWLSKASLSAENFSAVKARLFLFVFYVQFVVLVGVSCSVDFRFVVRSGAWCWGFCGWKWWKEEGLHP